MSQFFEYQCPDLTISSSTLSSFAVTEPSILAVTNISVDNNTSIQFYNDEAENITSTLPSLNRNCNSCTILNWNPKLPILATGWVDGTILLYSEKEKIKREDNMMHKNKKITTLIWSPEGTRLISGDETGTLCVWNTDQRGRLVHICHYNRKGSITHCIFKGPSIIAASNNSSDKKSILYLPPPFLFALDNGLICFADDFGQCTDVVNVGSSLKFMHYSNTQEALYLLTNDVILYKFKFGLDGFFQEKKVKLSIKGDGTDLRCCWAGSGLLAAANNESLVRIWHLDNDTNYFLNLMDPKHMAQPKDTIKTISYNQKRRLLVGGTASGRVCFWGYSGKSSEEPSDTDWEILPPVNLLQPINSFNWGMDGLLAVSTSNSLSILNETVLNCKQSGDNVIIQLTTEKLIVQTPDGKTKKLSSGIKIKGVDILNKNILIWNGKKAEVHELAEGNISLVSNFQLASKICALHREDIYCVVGSNIEVRSLQGNVKKVINFAEFEGLPATLNVWGDALVVSTSEGIIKAWDISRREHRVILPGKSFENLGTLRSVKINSKGTKISIICLQGREIDSLPSENIYVYDVESDKLEPFPFEYPFYPDSHFWDALEPKLLCVYAKSQDGSINQASTTNDNDEDKELDSGNSVHTIFSTPDGLKLQDSFRQPAADILVGIEVPFIYFLSRLPDEKSSSTLPKLKRKTMRDFLGLENVDAETKSDLLHFSYFLTLGNMDEAYRSVKKIQNLAIWENMAHMCVKTKRLDVAEVCLSNMGNAKGAAAVRLAKLEPEKEVAIAMVAIQLGLIKDAERLYKECTRHDLLVELYKSSGKWDTALDFCGKNNRIQLKTTAYEYATHLETIGETKDAIKMYEKSGNHRREVPRLLLAAGHFQELELYVSSSDDAELYKWYGAYLESQQKFDVALRNYTLAKDSLAIVKVLCYQGNFAAAITFCNEKLEPAPAYYLASQLESQGKIRESIAFFQMASRFNHAVRLAVENNLTNELNTLALESQNPQLQVTAARYFEQSGMNDKAVLLYQKGGNSARALELCFKAELYDSLHTIVDDLGPNSDPELLNKCGDYFLKHEQYDKAISLFVMSKQPHKALDTCVDFQTKLSEELADKMTADKLPSTATDEEKEDRNNLLKRIAKIARDQNNYLLACKKYSMANDKVKAMKCLLKHGDNEKIIYYATHTKKPEIYILAANYLQNLNWHDEPELIKSVVKFYSLAGAINQLADFYEMCAQIEMDDYRDYEKSLINLKECLKYLPKIKDVNKEERVANVEARVSIVEKFVDARRAVKNEPLTMIQICNQLLEMPDVEGAIRVGDVFAILIEYYHNQNNPRSMQQAYNLIERMTDRNITLNHYLDKSMLGRIYSALGINTRENLAQSNDNDEIDEEIPEEDM